jgi:hypothetical protein
MTPAQEQYRNAADAYMKAWKDAGQTDANPPANLDALLDDLIAADSAICRERGWQYPDRGTGA